jgi:hypothetical protein
MTRARSRSSGDAQLALVGPDVGRDDHVDVIVCDRYGRVVDVIPAHLGDRHGPRECVSLHEACLWSVLAAKNAAERLPSPTWASLPGHDRAGVP